MTNNDIATITLDHPVHGSFKVDAGHLIGVMQVAQDHSSLEDLHRAIQDLVGVTIEDQPYTDLFWPEACIVLSYLTGGSAD